MGGACEALPKGTARAPPMEPMLWNHYPPHTVVLFSNLCESVESVDSKLLSAAICDICGFKFILWVSRRITESTGAIFAPFSVFSRFQAFSPCDAPP
jgi:hypothetical protein